MALTDCPKCWMSEEHCPCSNSSNIPKQTYAVPDRFNLDLVAVENLSELQAKIILLQAIDYIKSDIKRKNSIIRI